MSTNLGVEFPCSHVEVGDSVAALMVTRVVPFACFTAKHPLLLLRLDPLSPGCDSTGGNSISNEAVIIRSSVERDEGVVEITALVPGYVQIPQLLASNRIVL
jgi:hypothetical protein